MQFKKSDSQQNSNPTPVSKLHPTPPPWSQYKLKRSPWEICTCAGRLPRILPPFQGKQRKREKLLWGRKWCYQVLCSTDQNCRIKWLWICILREGRYVRVMIDFQNIPKYVQKQVLDHKTPTRFSYLPFLVGEFYLLYYHSFLPFQSNLNAKTASSNAIMPAIWVCTWRFRHDAPANQCPSFPPPFLLVHYPLLDVSLRTTPSPVAARICLAGCSELHEKPAKDGCLNASRSMISTNRVHQQPAQRSSHWISGRNQLNKIR